MPDRKDSQRFRLHEIAQRFPPTAETLLLDTYLTTEASVSTRLFRVYQQTPPHYHVGSDEYLYVLEGRGTFWIAEAADEAEFAPGDLLCFQRGTVHALPSILAEPLVFFAIDVPRRDPEDIVFVDARDGTPGSFIRASGS